MSACGYSEELLSAYLDGEAGGKQREVERHLDACNDCRTTLESWRAGGQELSRLVNAGLGDVEPLVALSRIRSRIEASDQRSPTARAAAWWRDLWAFRRRAVAGVMVAAALGALCAPFVVLWAGRHLGGGAQGGAAFAGVVIESMELGGGTQVIYQGGSGTTTLIWVEPDASQSEHPAATP
jgi:anti-sigma factor RsiW